MGRIRIAPGVAIDESEIAVRFSRSSGPGGQHVNKASTRCTVYFDVAKSPSLTEAQKDRIRRALGGRISREGRLRVVASARRSQRANREAATQRLVALLAAALRPVRLRVATTPTAASKAKRVARKKHRGQIKRLRRARPEGDE